MLHGVETRRDSTGAVFHLCAACAERERRAQSFRRFLAAAQRAAKSADAARRCEKPLRRGGPTSL